MPTIAVMARLRGRAAIIVVAGVLVVAGCSSSSTSSSPDHPAGPAPSTPASPEPEPGPGALQVRAFEVPAGSRPHDVAPAADGSIWYTAQATGKLGRLDPTTGQVREFPLGDGSSPHGVIVGPDGAAWVTDSGLNALVRVDSGTGRVDRFPLPANGPTVNLNTAAFAPDGTLWFTGQAGYYGRLDPATRKVELFDAPRGRGPYGITVTPSGDVYYASLAGNHIARVDPTSGAASVIAPPTAGQGARRVWSDSQGRIWVSEWNAGQVAMFDPASGAWKEWPLPDGPERPGQSGGDSRAQAYAVYVDERDVVWLTDFGANAIVRFDPGTETFASFPLPDPSGQVRQLLGRDGRVWGAESAADRLVVVEPR